MSAYPHMRPVQEHLRPGRRRAVVVAVVLAVVVPVLGAVAGIAAMSLPSKSERAARQAAAREAITYVEREVGRSGATILVGQWWEGCGLYEVGLGELSTTVAVVEANGVWTVARESGKPAFTFHTDSDYTRADCLDIAA